VVVLPHHKRSRISLAVQRGFCVHWSSVNFSTFEKGVKSTHLTWRSDGTLHYFLENTLGAFAMHLPAPWIGCTK